MANSVSSPRRPRDAGATKVAIADAAARLLPERPPSSITGRQLADEAGVNYGLIHHHFGGKDGAVEAGMNVLRLDFVEQFGDGSETPFLGSQSHPYMRAMVRSLLEWPDSPEPDHRFRIVSAMVDAIADRLDRADRSEAKARTIAAVSLQIFYGVFGDVLLDATDADAERSEVERHLADLYDSITVR
jgi:AcrR family transcriptional regulator